MISLTAAQMDVYRTARAEGIGPQQSRLRAQLAVKPKVDGIFSGYLYPGCAETIEREGFAIEVKIEQDDWQDISYLGETCDTTRYQEDEGATIQNETRWREGFIPYYRFESYKIWDKKTGMLVDSEPRDVLYFRSKNHREGGGRMVKPETSVQYHWDYYRKEGKLGRHEAYTRARSHFLDDCKRISAWSNNDWTMTYVTVTVSYEGEELGYATLGGIESDSGAECYNEVAEELIEEALEEARKNAPERAAELVMRAEKLAAI